MGLKPEPPGREARRDEAMVKQGRDEARQGKVRQCEHGARWDEARRGKARREEETPTPGWDAPASVEAVCAAARAVMSAHLRLSIYSQTDTHTVPRQDQRLTELSML